MSVQSKPNREAEHDGSELPIGWAWSTVGEVTINCDGRRVPLKSADRDRRSGPYPYYGASGIIDDIDDFLFDGEFLLIAEDGANLLSRSTPIAFRASGKFWVNNHAHVVQPRPVTLLGFIEYYLNSIDLSFHVTGSAQPKLTQAALKGIRLPIAPLPEQRRIVGKLELLLGKVSPSQQRLSRVPGLLKRFRQSVLAAACSGKLTADWREENRFPEVAMDDLPDGVPEIPRTWSWKRLADVAQTKGGVTKGRKFDGKNTIRLPYLRVANVQDGYLDLSEIKEIEVLPDDREKYALKHGDILFTEGGDRDKLGRGTIWRDEIPDCIHQNHIFRARLITKDVIPDFVSLASKSESSRRYFFENASQTVNLASINLTMLSGLPVPLPPLSEQQEIARRVEKLFAFADQIESRLRQAQAHVDRLTQSLLGKAFRGELVPTEAELARRENRTYEPASELLERIRKTQPSIIATRKRGSKESATR